MRPEHLRARTIMHYLPAFGAALLLHAMAGAAVAGWLSPTPSTGSQPEPKRANAITAFIVAPEDPRFLGLNPVADTGDDWLPPMDAQARVSKGEFTFEIGKIVEHARVLFPFLTPGLSWDHFAPVPDRIIEKSLENPLVDGGSAHDEVAAPRALALDDATIQRIIDESWSRRTRWRAFAPIRSLAETYSADGGRLAELLQRYCDQNSLQPFSDATVRDPRLWAQLAVAADHVDFIAFIRRYTSDYPGSMAATALLFLLDSIVQGSRDALDALLESDPANNLAWTRGANPRAHELIAQLRRFYRRELTRRGLVSVDGITLYYDRVRLSILTRIVGTSPNGYRVNDARFLIGAIYWRQQRFQDALHSWRDIRVDPTDSYVEAYSRIHRMLQDGRSRPGTDADSIDPMLYEKSSAF